MNTLLVRNSTQTLDRTLVSSNKDVNVDRTSNGNTAIQSFDVCSGVEPAAGENFQIVKSPRPPFPKHHGRPRYGVYNPALETDKNIQSMFDTLMNFPFAGAK